jgi:hypothetical protein
MIEPAAAGGAAGYSGTPLARKLGVRPGHTLLLAGAPAGWTVPGLPTDVTVATAPARGGAPPPDTGAAASADVIVLFARSRSELERDLAGITSGLPAASSLWIAWPRRAAGHTSDITENGLRDRLLPVGVVDVKVAALDHDWSGLKFVWRRANRMPPRPT